jgi:hypothetical protein
MIVSGALLVVVFARASFPLERVGAVHLHEQETMTNGALFMCEKMGFSPWHALEVHRPLGSLNRLRKDTYYMAQKRRRTSNGQCPIASPREVRFTLQPLAWCVSCW